MNLKELWETMKRKLTKEEIAKLCEIYDNGDIDYLFENSVIPFDRTNYPLKYQPKDN